MATLTDTMQAELNEQINAEMYSAYLYMSMAANFEAQNLKGFAHWMTIQAQEEMVHAQKFYHFINERGGRIILDAIDKPPTEWATPLAAFADAYAHEQKVTVRIDALVEKAADVKDRATENFLQWFVAEQVEEEASADEVVQQIKLMADAPGGLFMLDREMAQRVFTPPVGAEVGA